MPILEQEYHGTKSALPYQRIQTKKQPAVLGAPVRLRAHRRRVQPWPDQTGFHEADVLVEPKSGPGLTQAGQIWRATDETFAPPPDPDAGGNHRPPKRQFRPTHTTSGKQPGDRRWRFRDMRPLLSMGMGLVLLVLLYTAIWGGRWCVSRLDNQVRYGGHTPTDTVTAVIGNVETTIYATNFTTKGSHLIKVMVVPDGQKTATILTEQLFPSVWGDVAQVIPSLTSLPNGGAQLVLTGDPSYFNLTSPIQQKFDIVMDQQGFQIVQVD